MHAEFDQLLSRSAVVFPQEAYLAAATVAKGRIFFYLYDDVVNTDQCLGRIRIILKCMARHSDQNFLILPRRFGGGDERPIDVFWAPLGEPLFGVGAGYDRGKKRYVLMGEQADPANTAIATRRINLTWENPMLRDEFLFEIERALAEARGRTAAIAHSNALN